MRRELEIYEQTFAPLQADGRLISSPETMIAWATTFRERIMSGPRVQSACYPGLYVVRVNSTAPHNRSWLNGHGSLDDDDLRAIDAALDAAPPGHLVVIALHHHVLPMPEEHAMERLSSWLGFIYTTELSRGRDLWSACAGAAIWCCTDTATSRAARACSGRRARCTSSTPARRPSSARVRVFAHNGVGHLLGQPLWLDVPAPWADAYQAFAQAEDEALSAAPVQSAGLQLHFET